MAGVDVIKDVAKGGLLLGAERTHDAVDRGDEALNPLADAAEVRIGVHAQRVHAVGGLFAEHDAARAFDLDVAMHVEDVKAEGLPSLLSCICRIILRRL
ncbi:hypothetical protein [Aeromonas veronii]|uniref:hypothetical protein n=1 Tax=Aeromonas veronii TaxID=654 RepID=UPI001F0A327B|nr:hypothetical protein [Aeromonas veronii]